jgi:superfamily II DNA or RNA helicase
MENEGFLKQNEDATKQLIDYLRSDSVQVRIYQENFLHGKAYIFPKLVISGSSNFTYSGFTNNTELNTVHNEPEAVYIREKWFNRLWERSDDFKDALIEILERSKFGTFTMPFDVYLKALYELQKDDIAWGEGEKADKIFGVSSKVELAEFQEDAVRRVFSRLKKYKGALVADSVGLGKTFVAKRIIEEFGYFLRKNFLIICPAQIRDTIWVKEMKDLGLSENIISQEDLGSGELQDKIVKALGSLDKIKSLSLIIIDESHNFRNPLSNRYEALFTLIEQATGQENTPMVLLLTATPINNTIWDLYFQLSLISRNNDKIFIKENVPNLKDFFKDIEKTSNVGLLEDVLHEISIRRTRQFIKEKYPEAVIAGKKIEFPERVLNTINYNLDSTYQGLYKEISDKIENDLKLAYYSRDEYLISGQISTLEAGRMKALAGIFKTILLKRLESSLEAFRISIKTQINFLTKFKEYLDDNKILTKKYYDKFLYAIEDPESNPEQITELEKFIEPFDPKDFDKEKFKSDIDFDIAIYQEIYDSVKNVGKEQDAKLKKLKDMILSLKDKGKLLIFTYYTDTLNYLFDALISDKDFLKAAGKKIERIYGAFPQTKRQKIIDDFLNGSIDILISTDILSEGQNLQKAQVLINYDLHWNPTRMIQRAGRIDRIGTPFKEIFIHNFFPEDELEELLKLVKRLQTKINQINESIGLDASVLGELINPKVFGALSVLKDGTEEEKKDLLDQLEKEQFGGGEKFWEPLRSFIEVRGKDYLESLPDGIRSGLEKKAGIRGVFFYFKYKEDYNFWVLHDVLTGDNINNKSQILDYISCAPDKPRVIPDDIDIYEIHNKVKEDILAQFRDVHGGTYLIPDKRNEKIIRDINIELMAIIEDVLLDYSGETDKITIIEEMMGRLEKLSFTKSRWKTLRGIWQDYKEAHRSWRTFIEELNAFMQGKKVLVEEEFEELDERYLKLVCVDLIS